jgi:uracil-DNA glycosylase family 4
MGCKTVCMDGFGPLTAKIMVIGEAPGATEDETGTPFVGRAGKVVRDYLLDAGIDPSSCYITNAVNCRPPDNKTPSTAQIRECKHWLQARIDAVKPKFVLLLGNVPLEAVLGFKGIKKARGNPIEQDGIIYMPTYHPAYVMRDPRAEAPFTADLKLFAKIVRDGGMPKEDDLNIIVVNSQAKVRQMLDDLKGTVSYDLETNSLYPWDVPLTKKEIMEGVKPHEEKKVISIQFGTRRAQYVLLLNHREDLTPWSEDEKQDIISRINNRLRNCVIVTHNGKFDALWMLVHYGVRWFPDFDTMLAHFLLDENALHSLKVLPQVYLGAMPYDIDVEAKRGGQGLGAFIKYGAKDAYYTRKLKFVFQKLLAEDTQIKRVFDEILMPCVEMFVEAEYHGVYIDTERMDEVEVYLQNQIDEAEVTLNNHAIRVVWDTHEKKFVSRSEETRPLGGRAARYAHINWGSSQQLGAFLYNHLKLPIIEKTDGGAPSTSESVLLRTDHPIAKALLSYRAAIKQKTSFIEGWRRFLVDNRLHPSFKLHGTVTGRLSCENPNLQQVPRDPKIRTLITAPPGWTLLECDLSQIEMRIAAELSGDRALREAYQLGIDVHWLTAIREIGRSGAMKDEVIRTVVMATQNNKKWTYGDAIQELILLGPKVAEELGKILNIPWKEVRKKAKAINFGYLYGMWWKKFRIYARDNYGVDISDLDAQNSRIAYFELYKDLPAWHNRQKRKAKIDGYVRSLSGRKRRLPDAMKNDGSYDAQAAERQAINSPVQSFANEINLMAALQIRREFGPDVVNIVGTVHDAILMEVRDDMMETVHNRVLEIMSQPDLFKVFKIKMAVPIEADAGIGPWGAGVSLDKWKLSRAPARPAVRPINVKSKPLKKRRA